LIAGGVGEGGVILEAPTGAGLIATFGFVLLDGW
jgi:hypothetical protein